MDRSVLIYFIVFLASFGFFCITPLKNEYLYKVIAESYNTTKKTSTCSNKTQSSHVDVVVEAEVSRLSLILNVLLLLPASITSIFITALGDHYGRKFALSIPIFGLFFAGLFTSLIIYFNWNLDVFFVVSFVSGLSGYYVTVLTQGMAYLGDIIVERHKRGQKFVILDTTLGVGGGAAGLVGGYWLKERGFLEPIFCSTLLFLVALFAIFFLPNPSLMQTRRDELKHAQAVLQQDNAMISPGVPEAIDEFEENKCMESDRNSAKKKSVSFITLLRSIKEVYWDDYSCCEKCCDTTNHPNLCIHKGHGFRGRSWRMWMYLVSDSFFMFVLIGLGEFQTIYFLSKPLCFTPSLIGGQQGLKNFLYVFSPIVVAVFQRFSLSNNEIALSGVLGLLGYAVIISFARSPLLVFVGTACAIFINITRSFLFAGISNMVLDSQQGSAFALLTCAENVMFLLSNVAFLNIYPATVTFYPGFAWLFGALVLTIPITLLTFLIIKDRGREPTVEEIHPLISPDHSNCDA